MTANLHFVYLDRGTRLVEKQREDGMEMTWRVERWGGGGVSEVEEWWVEGNGGGVRNRDGGRRTKGISVCHFDGQKCPH